jgi:hypothetical protein
MGLNIYFAKGFDTDTDGYFPNGYAVIHDEGIWDEEVLVRAFVPLAFQVPLRWHRTVDVSGNCTCHTR